MNQEETVIKIEIKCGIELSLNLVAVVNNIKLFVDNSIKI